MLDRHGRHAMPCHASCLPCRHAPAQPNVSPQMHACLSHAVENGGRFVGRIVVRKPQGENGRRRQEKDRGRLAWSLSPPPIEKDRAGIGGHGRQRHSPSQRRRGWFTGSSRHGNKEGAAGMAGRYKGMS